MGTGDFFPHEISGCGDPRDGSVAIYPTIFECQKALDALTLHSIPQKINYVKGLYLDYTCSDDDSYLEAKGTIRKSSGSSFEDSAHTSSGYVIDSDTDMDIDSGACASEDENYPLARGEIKETLQPSSDMHCMMASHDDVSGSRTTRVCGGQTASF
jgi:hypothetical protein